jgi:hypothetical protein
MTTPALTRQQLCAALTISESTVRRLELDGMLTTEELHNGNHHHSLVHRVRVPGRLEAEQDLQGTQDA